MIAALLLASVASVTAAGAPSSASAWVGPDRCVECHQLELHAWKESAHQRGFFTMHRAEAAKAIAAKMGATRVKREASCIACHYTPDTSDVGKAASGVSCESCHGPARDWIDVHADYGGKEATAATETAEHRTRRREKSLAAGMNAPYGMYDLSRRCFACHSIADEGLVNRGGHPASSALELVAWSQGEVRHNYFFSLDKKNRSASPARLRALYLIGQALSLEYALDALAGAGSGTLATAMTAQAMAAIAALDAAGMKVRLAEIDDMLKAAKVDLGLRDAKALRAASKAVGEAARRLSARAEAIDLSPLDPLLPPARSYRGLAQP